MAADNQEPPKDYAISAHADHFNGFVEGYIEGYHQAEKDLELTWEDVSLLRSILFDVEHEGFTNFPYEEFCKEVLKRFKAQKGNTNGERLA